MFAGKNFTAILFALAFVVSIFSAQVLAHDLEKKVCEREKDGKYTDPMEGYKRSFVTGQTGTPDTDYNQETYANLQFSFKKRLYYEHLYFGYTQKSFWATSAPSMPFREHNFNPEFFYDWNCEKWTLAEDFYLHRGRIGVEHESNGRDDVNSRSWNRVYYAPKFSYASPGGKTVELTLKIWSPFASYIGDPRGDYRRYLGNGEAYLEFGLFPDEEKDLKKLWLGFQMRQGNQQRYKSFQSDLQIYLADDLYFYFQYWDGNGESLIDHDTHTIRYAVGISLRGDPI